MDRRKALKENTILRCYNLSQGIHEYTVEKEIARGASCIVYEASYQNNLCKKHLVRIKECYPFFLSMIREEDNRLTASKDDEIRFQRQKEEIKRAFILGNELFYTHGITNFMPNTMDIYELNNTIYIVMAYTEGIPLSAVRLTSVRECFTVMKNTAQVMAKIHELGYLYLDIKPENILSVTGTKENILLFDFDSMIHSEMTEQAWVDREYTISYTKEYAALELKMGDYRNLGKQTDVYALGAVLFFLLFQRPPEAYDCDNIFLYEEPDYGSSFYVKELMKNKLRKKVSEFFHHTLADYPYDRYEDMKQVVLALTEMERLADPAAVFIVNTPVTAPELFTGRKKELLKLTQWSRKEGADLFFITGMGGSGKSTLVRKFLEREKEEFDIILVLSYKNSILETITDDLHFQIHGVQKYEAEKEEEYFLRKIAVSMEVSRGRKGILIIDNYEPAHQKETGEEAYEERKNLAKLLETGWKILLLTRTKIPVSKEKCLTIGSMGDRNDIYTIFQYHLGREIRQQEYPMVNQMIEKVQGHTLVMELIAKQIRHSFLSIEQAAELLNIHGFSSMAPEQVGYEKDCRWYMGTIGNIIYELFRSANMTEEKSVILKLIAFFGTGGIFAEKFFNLCKVKETGEVQRYHASLRKSELSKIKDHINMLYYEGWLTIHGDKIQIHPVIRETILQWKMEDSFFDAADVVMTSLKDYLKGAGESLKEDRRSMLFFCEEFLEHCKGCHVLESKQAYGKLFLQLLSSLPRDREEYILKNSIQLLQKNINFTEEDIIKLYRLVTEIYEERRELDEAYTYLVEAEKRVKKTKDYYTKAMVYDLWASYYDHKLDGRYDVGNREEARLLKNLNKALGNAVRCIKKSSHKDRDHLAAEYLRCQAGILIRSKPGKQKKIVKLMKKMELPADKKTADYFLISGWYFTYVEQRKDKMMEAVLQAWQAGSKSYENELDLIDCILVPIANILFESGKEEEAKRCLEYGIRLCNNKAEICPFVRKKEALEGYVRQIDMRDRF